MAAAALVTATLAVAAVVGAIALAFFGGGSSHHQRRHDVGTGHEGVQQNLSTILRFSREHVAIGGMAPVQGRPPTGAHRLIAGHSQYPLDIGPPIFDGATDLLQQQGLA